MPSKYKDIPGWSDEGMFKVYDKLVKELPVNATIIEVGSWKGRSGTYLLERTQEENREDLDIWFVDRFTGDEYGIRGNNGDDEETFVNNLKNAGFTRSLDYFMYVSDSIDFATKILPRYAKETKGYFAVFLDGNHQSDYVRKELLLYKELCQIVSGHDFKDVTINRIVREILGSVEDYGSSYLWRKT